MQIKSSVTICFHNFFTSSQILQKSSNTTVLSSYFILLQAFLIVFSPGDLVSVRTLGLPFKFYSSSIDPILWYVSHNLFTHLWSMGLKYFWKITLTMALLLSPSFLLEITTLLVSSGINWEGFCSSNFILNWVQNNEF